MFAKRNAIKFFIEGKRTGKKIKVGSKVSEKKKSCYTGINYRVDIHQRVLKTKCRAGVLWGQLVSLKQISACRMSSLN